MNLGMSHGLSVSIVHPLLRCMVLKGCDLESFCLFASFDKEILQETEARIREEEFDRLLDAASAFTHDERLGLHVGQTIELSSLGVLGYVLLNCNTLGEALAAYRRYNVILCSGIELEWETAGPETAIVFHVRDPFRQASRHAVEGMASSLHHIFVKLSCRNILPNMLQFAHDAPGDTSEYLHLFGVEPRFAGESNLLTLENEVLDYPIVFSNRELLITFETYAEKLRSKLLHGRTFGDQVYKWIARRMPSSFPGVPRIGGAHQGAARHLAYEHSV